MILLFLPAVAFATQNNVDRLINTALVPAGPPYQGEVRIIRRDSALVVQTLLYSKVMQRVVGAIQRKELEEWPEEKVGSVDSRRYTEELARAYHLVLDRAKKMQNPGDRERHIQLMIEFVIDEKQSYVALYAPTLTREGERLVLQKKELLKKLPLSRSYVNENMHLIIQDSFQVEADKAVELLRQ